MKKLFVYLFAIIVIVATSCKGNSSGQTGGAQADSGQNNVGNSGAADSTMSSSPQAVGTSGTDTSANGKGIANPTADTLKNNP